MNELQERIADDERHTENVRRAASYNALAAENAALRAELEHLQAAYADNEAYGYELIQQRNMARAELATLQAATAWRPVTEKRPSPGYYLTYHPKVGADVQYWTGYDSWVNGAYGRQPTYWRPLPPAPDEADEV